MAALTKEQIRDLAIARGDVGWLSREAPQYVASYRQLQQIKTQLAVDRCVEQIPYRLCHKIQEIRFGPDGVLYPTFEVVYMGGKVIEFENVDSFPTDADIARIAL